MKNYNTGINSAPGGMLGTLQSEKYEQAGKWRELIALPIRLA